MRGLVIKREPLAGERHRFALQHVLREIWGAAPPLPVQGPDAVQCTVSMDDELRAVKARRDKTRALKQAMMQELLTGRTRLV